MNGITGVPGCGKSMPVCKLAEKVRGNGALWRLYDPDGFNFLANRRSNTIISGGKNREER
jgi:hypothetical protein